MSLADDLERIATLADAFADAGEAVCGILAAEPHGGGRVYLCAYEDGDSRSWLALDLEGRPVASRTVVREAATLAALCEIAEETAGGGDLSELRAQLVALRLTENPEGIEEAEAAALALEQAVGSPPRLATAAYLDGVGSAARRLEHALGESSVSPFAEAMKAAAGAVETLAQEIVSAHKQPLS